jgi:hypothetical protein
MEPLTGSLKPIAQLLSVCETSKPSQNQSSKKYSNEAENVAPVVITGIPYGDKLKR